ncbi:unnamed protein product [Chondrus crispus]|uniref:[histone H3]-lysine(4) N-trimethyltransferase n=1 Tax=Chondrus crispus TaxID=2769 RepID=R7Q535_CHOCR|nr:unnamed protein product [Chondrus crispus]CDF33129.1 unnamed protein product [Chondrus crispus]|eukprot:XP_005712932.1 unnamed protein product [Chondrus crispus]
MRTSRASNDYLDDYFRSASRPKKAGEKREEISASLSGTSRRERLTRSSLDRAKLKTVPESTRSDVVTNNLDSSHSNQNSDGQSQSSKVPTNEIPTSAAMTWSSDDSMDVEAHTSNLIVEDHRTASSTVHSTSMLNKLAHPSEVGDVKGSSQCMGQEPLGKCDALREHDEYENSDSSMPVDLHPRLGGNVAATKRKRTQIQSYHESSDEEDDSKTDQLQACKRRKPIEVSPRETAVAFSDAVNGAPVSLCDMSKLKISKSSMGTVEPAKADLVAVAEKTESKSARTAGYDKKEWRAASKQLKSHHQSENRSLEYSKRENRQLNRSLRKQLRMINPKNDLFTANSLKQRRQPVKYRKSIIHGMGLFALAPIEAGEFVIEYIGEIIRGSVANLRQEKYTRRGMGDSYLFRLSNGMVLDATHKGCIARFINHSCDPNITAKIISIDGEDKIVFYSKRNIKKGEELTYDYKFDFEAEDLKIPCLCKAYNCRKFLN